MKLEIITVGTPISEPEEPVVEVFLKACSNGDLVLKAQHPGSPSWCLLTLKPDGKSFLHSYVSSELGFQVNKEGRLDCRGALCET